MAVHLATRSSRVRILKRDKFLTLLTLAGALSVLSACGVVGSRGGDGLQVLPLGIDADQDNVRNTEDKCPGSKPDILVDSSGCAALDGVIEGLDFASGDHRLTSRSREVLAELVAEMELYPTATVALSAHTDNRGSAAANLELSKRRVMSVVRYLVANGIESTRLKPFGYGESRPREPNRTAAGRALNRRIEISVVSYE